MTEMDPDVRISQPEAARLLGNVSAMTIWRWRNNPAMKFPVSVEINGRHYYSRAEILAWRPPAKPKKQAPPPRGSVSANA